MIIRILLFIFLAYVTYKLIQSFRNAEKNGGTAIGKATSGYFWLFALALPYISITTYNAEVLGMAVITQIIAVTAHFTIGLLYAKYRWNKLNAEKHAEFQRNKAGILNQYSLRPDSEANMSFETWIQHKNHKPNFEAYINRIAGWGMFWSWHLFTHIIKTLWNFTGGFGKNIHKTYKELINFFKTTFTNDQKKHWD